MIVFIPAYDEATTTNLNVVSSIIPENALALTGLNATRELLWQQLGLYPNLFAMSHGNSDVLWNNKNNAAIQTTDLSDFTQKKAFVFACYTANDLGRQFKINNNIYWGYTGSIVTSTDNPEVINIFRSIFRFILTNFPICERIEEITTMIQNLKILCDDAGNQLDDLYLADINVISSYTCINHIWNRLRVHHFALEEPLKHIESQEGDLFES